MASYFHTDFVSAGTTDYNSTITATASTAISFCIQWLNYLPIDESKKIIDEYKLRLKLYKKSLFQKTKISPKKPNFYYSQYRKIFIPTKKDWRGIESWK